MDTKPFDKGKALDALKRIHALAVQQHGKERVTHRYTFWSGLEMPLQGDRLNEAINWLADEGFIEIETMVSVRLTARGCHRVNPPWKRGAIWLAAKVNWTTVVTGLVMGVLGYALASIEGCFGQ